MMPKEPPSGAESLQDTDIDQASVQFIGRWQRLVSMTNWGKGQIICAWRDELIAQSVSANAYSDEAWSRRVGNISSQHVGRLRRVFRRFGEVSGEYEGLYWSHFCAALDWNDAEMWLEGAVRNGWSVSQMRQQRWEALGAPDELKPDERDILALEVDDEMEPKEGRESETMTASVEEVIDPNTLRGGVPDEDEAADEHGPLRAEQSQSSQESAVPIPNATDRSRPFENLSALPEDLADILESFKLAILSHKIAGWVDVSREDVLASLDALKQLVLAPSDSS